MQAYNIKLFFNKTLHPIDQPSLGELNWSLNMPDTVEATRQSFIIVCEARVLAVKYTDATMNKTVSCYWSVFLNVKNTRRRHSAALAYL